MKLEEVMVELENLGNERTKKIYIANGAHEPLFGVATGVLKPLAKKIKTDQHLAEQLYATGNYDAMYLAGMIADPKKMTVADFDRWIEEAYFFMVSDYVVAVTLAESDWAQEVADRFIDSDRALTASAGWSCYEWLLGWRPDDVFSRDKLKAMLDRVVATIHTQPGRVQWTMNNFVTAVGVSYLPLHDEALAAAETIGEVTITSSKGDYVLTSALVTIQKARDRGRLGFKRKAVRC